MTKIDPKFKVLIESLKEPARLVILAIIAWLLTYIIPQINEEWIPVITVILRFADKWAFEYGKETGARVIKLPF